MVGAGYDADSTRGDEGETVAFLAPAKDQILPGWCVPDPPAGYL